MPTFLDYLTRPKQRNVDLSSTKQLRAIIHLFRLNHVFFRMIRIPKHNRAESIVRGFRWNKRNDWSTKEKHRKYSVEERKRLPFVSQTTQCLTGVSALLVPSHLAWRIHRCTINRIRRQIKVLRETPIGMNGWTKSTLQRNNRKMCVLTDTISLSNSNLKGREKDLRIMVGFMENSSLHV